jgi:hypothetical protein
MPGRLKAIAFDLDTGSLLSLREAFPAWEIEVLDGATAASLNGAWDPGVVNLLVVKASAEVPETLGLCRFLISCGVSSTDFRQEGARTPGAHGSWPVQGERADAPLLLLVPPGQEPLVKAALEEGADCCRVLPVHAKELANMVARVRQGNWPGRHTLDLDQAQCEDQWRDEGGQG